MCKYETSVRKEKKLLDLVKPIPLTISLVKIKEVKLQERPQDIGKIRSMVEASIRQYAKEELGKGEEIVSQSIDCYEGENTVKASVLIEILEDIGTEKEIQVKQDKKEKKNH